MLCKSISNTETCVRMVAKKQGWFVNRDTEFVRMLVEGLTVNWNRYGYFLCPCRDTEGGRESDKDLICPCVYAARDIAEYGHCYCALYVHREFYDAGREAQSIPDRRFAR